MAKAEKEKCPRCGSEDFSVALGKDEKPDPKGKRYCKKCQHVWVQGLEAMSRTDVVLHQAQKEVQDLRKAIDLERKEALAFKGKVLALKDLSELQKLQIEITPVTEEEMFS